MTQACRVLAVGEILWDLFDDSRRLGGAPLNFAAHMSRLGHEVLLVSGIGDDELGCAALTEIKRVGLDCWFIQTIQRFPTGVARVLLGADGQTSFQIGRPAAYDALSLTAADFAAIAAWSPKWLYHGTLFPYNEQAGRTLKKLTSGLPQVSRFCDVNLRQGEFSSETLLELLAGANAVKMNESEMAFIAGIAGVPQNGTEDFCARAAERFGWDAVAVTLGKNGCAVWSRGEYAEEPGHVVQVADTVGSGDAFAAAMLHGLCRGWSARAIADFGNQLGSLIASRPGGMPDWTLDELRIPI